MNKFVLSALLEKLKVFKANNLKQCFTKRKLYLLASILDLVLIVAILIYGINPAKRFIQPLVAPIMPLEPLTQSKSNQEVFGFVPFWTVDKLSQTDFDTLTTMAYFGVPINGDGTLDHEDPGYITFKSREATDLFKKAHAHGTKVVLTVTQMRNGPILALMDDSDAQDRAIKEITSEVNKRGIDGVNIDMEYSGDPGQSYRGKFSTFIAGLTNKMHISNPNSYVTVSVYASAIKEPKIYDIAALGKSVDSVFMMAYDFATAGSDNAIPTSPLYGYKSGKYWYDVSTAVDDFLSQMPAKKLVLGLPWYGYNYLVYQPEVKAETRPYYSWRGTPKSQPYEVVQDDISANMNGIDAYQTGWDNDGQVGWKAYHVTSTDTWRMVFIEDTKSLAIKYDFAKNKTLGGVGIWALGFEDGKPELWALLREKFGVKYASSAIVSREIASDENN